MLYLLFIFYLAIGCIFIPRLSFVSNSGLKSWLIVALYLLKIIAGLGVGWISYNFFPTNDYWGMNIDGMKEYHLMLTDPKEFFTNILTSPYHHYNGFFDSIGSYWNDLRNNIILKLLAFCNLLSQGNYYINSLLLNSFGFIGHIALYRVFADIYKNKKWQVIIGCFLLPSTLYYSSAIYKDLFVFAMLGFFCYGLYFSIQQKFTGWRISLISFSVIGLLLFRNFIVIALVPAAIAYIFSYKTRVRNLIAFPTTYLLFFLLALILQWTLPGFQPLKIITQKQEDFADLPVATSQLPLKKLAPELGSFFKNIPQAMNHGFLRPTIGEAKGFMLVAAIELLLYQLLLLTMIIFPSRNDNSHSSFIWLTILFSVSMIIITGLVIPNMGSIIRYRSLYLPFLLVPILCSIKFNRS